VLEYKKVRHRTIPEDNNEATIVSIGAPENVVFDFAQVDHYGDAELGIPFTATVDCEFNFTIYKGDYYSLSDPEDFSIDDWSDHYFDAHKEYTLNVEGYITITIDTEELEKEDLTEEKLADLINDADLSTDITERTVHAPEW
jgi:hypothetical protein